MAQGRAAEQRAKAAQGNDEKYPDWRTDLAGFHAALARSHARYMEKFPPGYDPLAQALKAFAAAAPVERTRPGFEVPKGASLSETLAAFRRWANGDDELEEVEVAGAEHKRLA
jgi:hypothetical protein